MLLIDHIEPRTVAGLLALQFLKHHSALAAIRAELLAKGVREAADLTFAMAMAGKVAMRAIVPGLPDCFTVEAPGLAGLAEWNMRAAAEELANALFHIAGQIQTRILPGLAPAERAELAEALMLAEEALAHGGGEGDSEREVSGESLDDPTTTQRAAWAALQTALAA